MIAETFTYFTPANLATKPQFEFEAGFDLKFKSVLYSNHFLWKTYFKYRRYNINIENMIYTGENRKKG